MTNKNISIYRARLWESILPSAERNVWWFSRFPVDWMTYPSQQTMILLKVSRMDTLEHSSAVFRRLGNLKEASWSMMIWRDSVGDGGGETSREYTSLIYRPFKLAPRVDSDGSEIHRALKRRTISPSTLEHTTSERECIRYTHSKCQW
jgi:hypothetical protein